MSSEVQVLQSHLVVVAEERSSAPLSVVRVEEGYRRWLSSLCHAGQRLSRQELRVLELWLGCRSWSRRLTAGW